MSSRPNFALAGENPQHFGLEASLTYIWDVPTLTWVKNTGSGGGGGGAVTVADGADVAQGTTTDVAWVAGAGTVISLLKKIASAGGSAVSIADGADVAQGTTSDVAWVSGSGTIVAILKKIAGGIGGLTDTQLRATPVPVSGTVTTGGLTDTQLRATPVPVSGTVTATGPLTDTQLRATPVPVSGTVTANQGGTWTVQPGNTANTTAWKVDGSAVTQPVSGTFFQATQPVSGTVTTTPPANASTNVAQIAGTATDVNSGVKSAGTIRVVLATDQPALTNKLLVTPDLPSGASTSALQTQPGVDIGDVTINNAAGASAVNVQDAGNSLTVDAPVGTPLFARLSDGSAALVGQKAMAASLPVVVASDQATFPVTATGPTLTKGTQGATGFSTQDLKDAGRNQTSYFMPLPIVTTSAEVMMSMTGYKGGAAVAPTVSPAVVTAAKTYRIQAITVTYQAIATAGTARVTLRANLSGAGVIGSPLVWEQNFGAGAAAVGLATTTVVPFPDGVEFPAGTGIAVGIQGFSSATPPVGAAVGLCQVWIQGYEY